MLKGFIRAMIGASLFMFIQCTGAPGCMARSFHIKRQEPTYPDLAYRWQTDERPFDYKNYHYVECNHDCSTCKKTSRGKCIYCGHYGEPDRGFYGPAQKPRTVPAARYNVVHYHHFAK